MRRYGLQRYRCANTGKEYLTKTRAEGEAWSTDITDMHLFRDADIAISYARMFLDRVTHGSLMMITVSARVVDETLL